MNIVRRKEPLRANARIVAPKPTRYASAVTPGDDWDDLRRTDDDNGFGAAAVAHKIAMRACYGGTSA